jgi:hypothetical protein
MSTLVAQTISNGTVSTSSANVIQGSAKAWVNFDGTGPAIRASYNVSSVTRASLGNYTINFTNAFADTNYAFTGSTGYDTVNQTSWIAAPPNVARATWKQTTSLSIWTGYANTLPATVDPSDLSLMVLR